MTSSVRDAFGPGVSIRLRWLVLAAARQNENETYLSLQRPGDYLYRSYDSLTTADESGLVPVEAARAWVFLSLLLFEFLDTDSEENSTVKAKNRLDYARDMQSCWVG